MVEQWRISPYLWRHHVVHSCRSLCIEITIIVNITQTKASVFSTKSPCIFYLIPIFHTASQAAQWLQGGKLCPDTEPTLNTQHRQRYKASLIRENIEMPQQVFYGVNWEKNVHLRPDGLSRCQKAMQGVYKYFWLSYSVSRPRLVPILFRITPSYYLLLQATSKNKLIWI